MVKGGYQIIDFNGVELRKNISMQFSNIYEKIEGTSKAILLSGLNVDGIDYRDVFCTPIVIGSSYVIKVFNFRIYISDDDIVRVEDEILFLGDNISLTDSNEQEVSPYVYNRLEECLRGNFSTFKAGDNNPEYITIVGCDTKLGFMFFISTNTIRSVVLIEPNKIQIM